MCWRNADGMKAGEQGKSHTGPHPHRNVCHWTSEAQDSLAYFQAQL